MSSVSRETAELLQAYAALLRKWNRSINLVAPSTLDQLEDRHIKDCAQIWDASKQLRRDGWADLGSGGGLPGVIVAILGRAQLTKITLIESDRRKAAFLQTVRRELGLSHIEICAERIENAHPCAADIVSARALADLTRLLGYIAPHLSPGGTALLMKGRNWKEEVESARQEWDFSLESVASKTEADAAILMITDIQRI